MILSGLKESCELADLAPFQFSRFDSKDSANSATVSQFSNEIVASLLYLRYIIST